MPLLLGFDQLPANASVDKRLDVCVNRASLLYGVNLMFARTVVDVDVGLPNERDFETFNSSLYKLAYFSDARAKCESEALAVEDERTWGGMAIKGLERVSRYFGRGWRLVRTLPFNDADLLVETYHDMRNARDLNLLSPEGLNGIEYGTGVARLEELKM